MALEGRHMHRKGYEYWKYRRSFGKFRLFEWVPYRIGKTPGKLKLLMRYSKYMVTNRNYSGLVKKLK